MLKDPIPQPTANAWSERINGLSARLHVELEDLEAGVRLAVYLELRNDSLSPVAVTNQPRVHAETFDSQERPVGTSGFPMSGPVPSLQWAVIPRDAYIGFRIDMQTVGVPTREHRMALLAVGGKTWGLRPGTYVLKTSVAFGHEEDGPANQWVGELVLPPVEIVVTAQVLTPNRR